MRIDVSVHLPEIVAGKVFVVPDRPGPRGRVDFGYVESVVSVPFFVCGPGTDHDRLARRISGEGVRRFVNVAGENDVKPVCQHILANGIFEIVAIKRMMEKADREIGVFVQSIQCRSHLVQAEREILPVVSLVPGEHAGIQAGHIDTVGPSVFPDSRCFRKPKLRFAEQTPIRDFVGKCRKIFELAHEDGEYVGIGQGFRNLVLIREVIKTFDVLFGDPLPVQVMVPRNGKQPVRPEARRGQQLFHKDLTNQILFGGAGFGDVAGDHDQIRRDVCFPDVFDHGLENTLPVERLGRVPAAACPHMKVRKMENAYCHDVRPDSLFKIILTHG